MTLRSKKKLVGGLLLAFTLWPAAHRVMAFRYGMNPWKFCGWAMYVTPALPATVEIFKLVDGRLVKLAPSRLPPGRDRELASFVEWRKYAGSMVRPDTFARTVFEARPDLEAIAIVMTDRFLDRRTATVEVRRYGYRYRRGVAPPNAGGPPDRGSGEP